MLDYIKTKLLFMPVLASEHGKDVDDFIVYIHILMAALFVGWFAYFIIRALPVPTVPPAQG